MGFKTRIFKYTGACFICIVKVIHLNINADSGAFFLKGKNLPVMGIIFLWHIKDITKPGDGGRHTDGRRDKGYK